MTSPPKSIPPGSDGQDDDTPSALESGAGLIVCAIAGVSAGIIGTMKHQIGATGAVPSGAVLSLLVVALLLVGLRLLVRTRWAAGVAGAGVVGAVALFTTPGPGDSVLLVDNTAGMLWAVGPAIVVGLVLAWPRLRRGTTSRGAMASLDGGRGIAPEEGRDPL